MAMQGTHFREIDDDIKARFLELVANGYTRQEAALALEASPRQIRACCSPKSHRYDPAFAEAYAELTKPDGEHVTGMAERLESAGLDRAINRGSDRLLEKYSVIYDKRWAVHKPQSMQINFNIDEIRAEFAQLPDEALRAYVEQKKQEQLEAGDIIDAETE